MLLQDLFRTNNFCHVFHAILDENGKQSFMLAFWLFWRKNTNFYTNVRITNGSPNLKNANTTVIKPDILTVFTKIQKYDY